ncbi:hypothetical protein AQJ64_15380 [Streptomyces griseoruber]|uniref:Uncharacterized protein n=1 Tax=Streptomyces griseoruber TaxID=1943 RepID=A0A101T1Y3_9ACTN|nr:hypothetical protein AQJ64_15380 [Streptomyces griseoruber]
MDADLERGRAFRTPILEITAIRTEPGAAPTTMAVTAAPKLSPNRTALKPSRTIGSARRHRTR